MVNVKPLFISSVSVVTSAPGDDRRLFVDVLGLPLTGDEDYLFTEALPGVKHFGVWPLAQAARSCFGTETWPVDRPVSQASIEFDENLVRAPRKRASHARPGEGVPRDLLGHRPGAPRSQWDSVRQRPSRSRPTSATG